MEMMYSASTAVLEEGTGMDEEEECVYLFWLNYVHRKANGTNCNLSNINGPLNQMVWKNFSPIAG